MSSKEKLEGLEDQTSDKVVATKVKKELTAEEIAAAKALIDSGVAKITEMNPSANFLAVLELVAVWGSEDKDALAAAKAKAFEAFGGSENLKNYIDTDFQTEMQSLQGIAKVVPILNNIKSFYARRENTGSKKVKTVQISIAGVIYNVDAEYSAEIADLPRDERKTLLLQHPSTTKVEVAEEII
jgi:hypothetical protein